LAQISAAQTSSQTRAAASPDQAIANRYRLRAAGSADVRTLEELEREAFPTMTAGTPFRSDIGRTTSLYLLATRDSVDSGNVTGRPPSLVPRLLRDLRSLGRVLLFEPPRREAAAGPEHVAGFVGLWFVLDEAHVIVIATRREERLRGVGELLMIGAFEAALARGSRVLTLEVRASNEAARALYRKYGFEDAGLRKRYYTDNNEDAIIMTTPSITTEAFRARLDGLVRMHAGRWGSSERPTTPGGHATHVQ
jgi:ribosomal-protein-alanine N-acetyltransferase